MQRLRRPASLQLKRHSEGQPGADRQEVDERVRFVRKLVYLFLALPLLTVMATKDPRGMGHVVQAIIMIGAGLLEFTAKLLSDLANLLAGKNY